MLQHYISAHELFQLNLVHSFRLLVLFFYWAVDKMNTCCGHSFSELEHKKSFGTHLILIRFIFLLASFDLQS